MSQTFGAKPHKLDSAGRMKLRDEERRVLGSQVVLACGQDGCINVFTLDSWQKFAAVFDKLPVNNAKARRLRRLLRDTGEDCEVDAQNRLRIPEGFLKWAGLGGVKLQARLVYAGDRWELWEEEAYWQSLKAATELEDETQQALDAASEEEGP